MFTCSTIILLFMMPLVYTRVLDDDMMLFWRRSEQQKTCEPFTTYQESCNRCVCSADSIPYCTKMACFKPRLGQVETNIVLPINGGNEPEKEE